MFDLLNTWQFNLIGCLITSVLFLQSYKTTVRNVEDDGAATILLQIIAGISILPLAVFFPFKFSSDPKVYLLLFTACIFYATSDRLHTTVRKHLEVSVASILGMLKTFFLVMIAIMVFKEDIVLAKVIGTFLILFGNGVLFFRKGGYKIDKYALLAVLAALVVSIAISIDVGISALFNLPIYISTALLLPAVFLFVFENQKIKNITKCTRVVKLRQFILTGVSWSLMILFMLRSYQLGEVITVAPLLSTTVLLNVVVAYFFHKEEDHLWRKIIATVIVLFGVYLTLMVN